MWREPEEGHLVLVPICLLCDVLQCLFYKISSYFGYNAVLTVSKINPVPGTLTTWMEEKGWCEGEMDFITWRGFTSSSFALLASREKYQDSRDHSKCERSIRCVANQIENAPDAVYIAQPAIPHVADQCGVEVASLMARLIVAIVTVPFFGTIPGTMLNVLLQASGVLPEVFGAWFSFSNASFPTGCIDSSSAISTALRHMSSARRASPETAATFRLANCTASDSTMCESSDRHSPLREIRE